MKYFAALPLAASLAAAQMQAMSLQPVVPSGATTHTTAAAPSTVTVVAGGAGAPGTATAAAALSTTATVVAGSGTDSQGQACSCECLCGMNAFPANAAVNYFGGFPGMIA